ncbi:unnamed protein product [Prunus armeniaca]
MMATRVQDSGYVVESFSNRLRQAIATLEEGVFGVVQVAQETPPTRSTHSLLISSKRMSESSEKDSKSPCWEEIESNSHEDDVGTDVENVESKYLEECSIEKNKVVMCAGEGNQATTNFGEARYEAI